MNLVELLNFSINETLSHTLMTSTTVFVAVLALVIFGGRCSTASRSPCCGASSSAPTPSIWIACAGLVFMKLRPEQLRHGKRPPRPKRDPAALGSQR
jgi:preprotein translocase subunit SecF